MMHEHHLCSPSRMEWVTKKKPSGCIFCKISKGGKNVPNMVLYKDKGFMVVMNIFPYNTGHLQVCPVRHVTKLEDLSDNELSRLFIMVKRCQLLLTKALSPMGFNTGFNQGGDCAGASVEHLHVHIVPRFKRDFGFIDIIGRTKVLPEPVGSTFKKLKRHVKMLE
ncbi:MAG: HIT domain-containing protein [Candidatus Aenigmarchaeota archaeon]|nr:HIT domain-containing protein [Candidatus Aenigmarchaeota archaeon]